MGSKPKVMRVALTLQNVSKTSFSVLCEVNAFEQLVLCDEDCSDNGELRVFSGGQCWTEQKQKTNSGEIF